MTAKKDPIDTADQLLSDLDYTRTLLNAAGDKVHFYLKNRKLLGPQGEPLYGCAQELESLLSLAERFLERMKGDMETVTDILCKVGLPCGAE